jgi:hypothetical protein
MQMDSMLFKRAINYILSYSFRGRMAIERKDDRKTKRKMGQEERGVRGRDQPRHADPPEIIVRK